MLFKEYIRGGMLKNLSKEGGLDLRQNSRVMIFDGRWKMENGR